MLAKSQQLSGYSVNDQHESFIQSAIGKINDANLKGFQSRILCPMPWNLSDDN